MAKHTYAGWVPNITGRLSFSRVGSRANGHRAIVFNKTAEAGAFLAIEKRTSQDGPIADFLLPLARRSADIFVATSLKRRRGPLPFDLDADCPELRDDDHAELEGQAIIFSWGRPFVPNRVRELTTHIRRTQDPLRNAETVQSDIARGDGILSALWSDLTNAFLDDPAGAPVFAKAYVRVSRTGECHVDVEEDELFSQLDVKRFRRMLLLRSRGFHAPEAPTPNWEGAARTIARHTFFFVRDLAHRHYHHDRHSDLATTIYPWSRETDDHWRRETHYGLVRMAIAARRQNSIRGYKQAQGVIAYADSFQRHLAGWVKLGSKKRVERRSDFFPYDFGALRASVDASSRGLEFDQSERNEFVGLALIGLLTTLGLLLASGQVFDVADRISGASSAPMPPLAHQFWGIMRAATENPVAVLAFVFGVLWVASAAALRLLAFIVRRVGGSLLRATTGAMGGITALFENPAVAWLAATAFFGLLAYGIGRFYVFALSQFLRLIGADLP